MNDSQQDWWIVKKIMTSRRLKISPIGFFRGCLLLLLPLHSHSLFLNSFSPLSFSTPHVLLGRWLAFIPLTFSLIFACFSRTEFIAWCLRRSKKGIPLGSSIFVPATHESRFVRSPHCILRWGPCAIFWHGEMSDKIAVPLRFSLFHSTRAYHKTLC